jgi:hypothetical protein
MKVFHYSIHDYKIVIIITSYFLNVLNYHDVNMNTKLLFATLI